MATESQTRDNDLASTDASSAQTASPPRSIPKWLGAALAAGVAGIALGLALGFASRIDSSDHEVLTPVSIASGSKTQEKHESAHASGNHPQAAQGRGRHRERSSAGRGHAAAVSNHRHGVRAAGDGPIDSYVTAARAAATAFAEGRYRVARAIYVAALESDDVPSTIEAEMRAGLAACYSRLGRKREAIEQAARAADLLLAEGSGKTLIELGDRLLERGNDVGARRRYARVLLTSDRPWADPGIEALAELRMAVAWQRAAERIASKGKAR